MTSFPKYDRYKDSGVEWLGEVPEHWEVEKGLRYFLETEDRSVKGDEELLSVSHLADIVRESAVYKEEVEGNADEQNRKLAQESIIGEIVRKQRRKDMSLYKNYAEDPDFRKSVEDSIIRILALHDRSMPA